MLRAPSDPAEDAGIPYVAQIGAFEDFFDIGKINQAMEAHAAFLILLGDDDLFGMVLEQLKKIRRMRGGHDLHGLPILSKGLRVGQAVHRVADVVQQARMQSVIRFFKTNNEGRFWSIGQGQNSQGNNASA